MNDVELAKDFVAKLLTRQSLQAFVIDPCRIYYSHDSYIDHKSFDGCAVQCSPHQIQHIRAAREHWTDKAVIQVSMVARAKSHNDDSEIDRWIEFVDEITYQIKNAKPSGKKSVLN